MKIEERFKIEAPAERVWAAIRDAQVVAPCIPGCKSVETIDATHYRAVVAVALGPIKAVFNLIIEIASEVPGKELTTVARGEEGGKASSLNARSLLRARSFRWFD